MISTGYRTNDPNLHSSDSDENNSDDDEVAWQRKPTRFNNQQQHPFNGNIVKTNLSDTEGKKRKVNNVWSTVLQDQSLSDEFGGFNMERKREYEQDRNCESYDYRRKRFDTRPDMLHAESESVVETVDSNEVFGVKMNEPAKVLTSKKRWRPSPEEKQAARLIIRKLNEKKKELIYNVVKVLGIPKAMDLLGMTENIEDNGGMMTVNGSRRRTPGGVFFQLIKSDKYITKAQHNEIFTENRHQSKKLSNKKKKPLYKVTTMEVDEKFPNIPSAADLFLSECSNINDSKMVEANDAVDSEREEGEICD